jgi:hypothetical protein
MFGMAIISKRSYQDFSLLPKIKKILVADFLTAPDKSVHFHLPLSE